MALSKKTPKSANNSSVTLHNFFTPSSSKTAPSLAKRKSSSDKRKPRPDEIIVIDSDDEPVGTPSRSSAKKPKLLQSSSVEALDEAKPVKRHSSYNGVAPLKQSSPDPIFFGQPTELLLPSTSTTPVKAELESEMDTSFGRPTDKLLGSHDCPSHAPKTPIEKIPSENSFNDDDWGMGDDEMGMQLADDDIEAENIVKEELLAPDLDSIEILDVSDSLFKGNLQEWAHDRIVCRMKKISSRDLLYRSLHP
jgi:hypothetical protein